MKNTIYTAAMFLATASLMTACSWSGPVDHKEASKEEPKVQVNNEQLLFTFQGADAYCTSGVKAEEVRNEVVYNIMTFKADGTFVSDTNISEDNMSHREGTYTVEGDILRLTNADGKVEQSNYVVEGDNLTLNVGPSVGNCPEGESLFIKYVKFQPEVPKDSQPEVKPETEIAP